MPIRKSFVAWTLAAVVVLTSGSLAAQGAMLSTPCNDAFERGLISADQRAYCFAVAQAAQSAQPQLGILVAAAARLRTSGTRISDALT